MTATFTTQTTLLLGSSKPMTKPVPAPLVAPSFVAPPPELFYSPPESPSSVSSGSRSTSDFRRPHLQSTFSTMTTETLNSTPGGMDDEEMLYKKLSETEDFNERRTIRAQLKAIRLNKTNEWNKSKETRDNLKVDANKLRQEQSKQQKLRKMESFDRMAKENREKGQTATELAFRERQKVNEEEKQRKLDEFKEIGKVMSKAYHQEPNKSSEMAAQNSITVGDRNKEMKMRGFQEQSSKRVETDEDGNTTTTMTNKSVSRDGNRTTITQSKNITKSGLGGTSYGLNKSAGRKGGAMSAFQNMDSSNNGSARPNYLGAAGGKGVQRSASTVKAMLLEWVKQMVKGYEHVDVQNFSTSWNNGMAFCALIHHFFPQSFEYAKLNPKNRRFNFTLAFEVAEKFAGISPLLDVEDMVRMKNPDWKCVFTSVQCYYRWFKSEENKSPGTPGQAISPLVTSEVKVDS